MPRQDSLEPDGDGRRLWYRVDTTSVTVLSSEGGKWLKLQYGVRSTGLRDSSQRLETTPHNYLVITYWCLRSALDTYLDRGCNDVVTE
jgi:hypothetical protein